MPQGQLPSKGFTLLEMIIVLLLIVLLLAWGAPNYQNLKARQMVTDTSNEFVYGLTLARAEAVRLGTNVEVRKRGGDWSNGWRIWAKGLDGASDEELAKNTTVNSKITISGLGDRIVFNRLGGLEGTQERAFEVTNSLGSGATSRVVINMSGSAKVIKQ